MYFFDRATEMLLHDPSVVGTVTRRLDKCLDRARKLVERNRSTLDAVAAALEAAGYLDQQQITTLFAKNPQLKNDVLPIAPGMDVVSYA